MSAKMDLASELLLYIDSSSHCSMRQIIELLGKYHVSYNDGHGKTDFENQLSYFLGAKKTEGMSKRTVGNYRQYLNDMASYLQKKPEEIMTNDIRDFISHLSTQRHLKDSSLAHVINVMRSFFGWLSTEEIISKNPMLRIKSIKVDKLNARHPLSTEELERLRNACIGYREKALVEFFCSSGCRLSEAAQIDLRGIDLVRRTVSVIGKGNKERLLFFSIRAKLMLDEYIKSRPGGTALFAAVRKPYDRLSTRSIEKIIQTIGERAGIARRVHPHILRHTFATQALNSGMDIVIIQQLLGHASVGTTQIYAEVSRERVCHEYEKFIA